MARVAHPIYILLLLCCYSDCAEKVLAVLVSPGIPGRGRAETCIPGRILGEYLGPVLALHSRQR
jgi:hypothetical protein